VSAVVWVCGIAVLALIAGLIWRGEHWEELDNVNNEWWQK
jgi:hypothetical protein